MYIHARKKMRGQIAVSCLRACVPAVLALLGTVTVVPAALCLFYGTGTVLANAGLAWLAGPYMNVLIPAALLAAGTLIFLFAFAFAFYAKAWVYFTLDRNQTRPKSLLKPSQALRYVRCRVGVAARRALWFALYALPAAVLAAVLYLSDSAGWTEGVFAVLCAADAVFALAGLAFFAVASSAYCLTDYLLYLNPLLPPGEAIRSSVDLTRGRLPAIAARRLSRLPWLLAGLLVLPAPFAFVYRRFCAAALCERLYGEDKRKAPSPAVVFYVSRRSRIVEAGGSQC